MVCYGRRFFITDQGSMGLAPARAREGDEIVFFLGGKVSVCSKDDRAGGEEDV